MVRTVRCAVPSLTRNPGSLAHTLKATSVKVGFSVSPNVPYYLLFHVLLLQIASSIIINVNNLFYIIVTATN